MTSPSHPPLKVPNYVFSDKIGSGAYGDVYKAFKKHPNKNTTEIVAIKVVQRSTLSAGGADSLISEIGLLKKLKHDHIVQLKDFLCDDNYIYILMEYCSGGDLSHFIKSRHRLPEAACQRFLQQIASALQYMRDENVSHFDLKPQNILLSSRRNPVIKLGDFGLAQHMPETASASKVKGSPLYMAPEILLKKKYDARVDLWSVGVILYESLFGRAPYSSSTLEELVQKIKTDTQIKLPHNCSISPNCTDLLSRCLERDPSKRITFEEFFNHPFVDLEHKPSEENINKARSLLNEAVQLDEKNCHEDALKLYTESLLYLVPALHAESNASRKAVLRKSVKQYLDRTEKLKEIIANGGVIPEPLPSSLMLQTQPAVSEKACMVADNTITELMSLASSTPGMAGAIDIAKAAELYDIERSYSTALEKYELALEKLLELLRKEPPCRRKDLLSEVIRKWMTRAEFIKSILDSEQTKEDAEENPEASLESSSTEKKKKKGLLRQISKAGEDSIKSIGKSTLPPGFGSSFANSSKVLTEADYEKHCGIQ